MEHVQQRLLERVSEDMDSMIRCVVRTLVRRAKEKKLPNTTWYKPVFKNGQVIAFICGKGTSVKTVLAGDMIPHGVAI